MKITVDQSLCEATGMCTGLAPDLFELDEEGTIHLLDSEPGEELRSAVEQAVRNCPMAAITCTG
ncbi:MAG: ferredoxin [Trebonia sp.]|jgi:ferredoxin